MLPSAWHSASLDCLLLEILTQQIDTLKALLGDSALNITWRLDNLSERCTTLEITVRSLDSRISNHVLTTLKNDA